ncbi:DUF6916 family protein [Sphingomonas sp. LT1P40]|uniref:DUF6916 family protein n=1 Tax=Alteristakelama amylovorans TaxID=3096166 RepID=UPI002FC67442
MTLDDVAERVGTAYTIFAGDVPVLLTLDLVESLNDSGRVGGSFRLEFVGPVQPILPQGIYRFSVVDAEHDIFVAPISSGAQGTRYEAIFY